MSAPLTARPISSPDPALIPPRWRLPARLTFLAVVVLTVLLFAGGLPEYYRQLTTVCPTATCPNAPTATMVQTYASGGITVVAAANWQVFLVLISAVLPGLVALLIFWRRPDNRMAWFTALTLLTFGAFGIHGTDKIVSVLVEFALIWRLVVLALILVGSTAITLFFFLFPDGSFQPPALRLVISGVLVFQTLGFIFPSSLWNPDTWPLLPLLLFWFSFLGLCVYAQVYRYRRVSNFAQRQQTKWVVLGITLAVVGALTLFTLLTVAPFINPAWAVWALFSESSYYLMLLFLPLSVALAVFRSGLYDVDVVINRALTYGALTALLAAIYAGLIIGSQAVITRLTGQTSDLALIVSTLAIVALFQPLRRAVQGFVDQRFYRRRYDNQQVLTAFAGALRDHPYTNPDDLSQVLVNLVDATIKPAHIALRLVDGAEPRRAKG